MSLFVEDISFTGSTNQINHLADILTSITSINHHATISIKQSGITIYASYNHIITVRVIIDPSLFNIYNLTGSEEAELRLSVDINLISECFTSVSNSKPDSVICLLNYQGDGYPLVIEFEDNLISEKLEFLTFYQEEEEEQEVIDYGSVDMELIVKSDVLSNMLYDLHQINTEDLYIYTKPDCLRFTSMGPIGIVKLIFPNEKTILEKVEINKPYMISKFSFNNFFKIFKAVKFSFKCKMIKDNQGRFSIQLLVKNNSHNYSGTLIQFNMLEINHDEGYMDILEDEEEGVVDIQRTMYEGEKRVEEVQRAVKNVGGAVEIPLFL
ncbi:DNA damage checkpoint control protein RAD17 [Spathaspora sp. JA1]|nr:DNA damage checkpoint control protein RAD17 [Spathaspora sp. JA1]